MAELRLSRVRREGRLQRRTGGQGEAEWNRTGGKRARVHRIRRCCRSSRKSSALYRDPFVISPLGTKEIAEDKSRQSAEAHGTQNNPDSTHKKKTSPRAGPDIRSSLKIRSRGRQSALTSCETSEKVRRLTSAATENRISKHALRCCPYRRVGWEVKEITELQGVTSGSGRPPIGFLQRALTDSRGEHLMLFYRASPAACSPTPSEALMFAA